MEDADHVRRESRDVPQLAAREGNAEATVPTETTQPESGLGKWAGIAVSIAIGVALILVTITQL